MQESANRSGIIDTVQNGMAFQPAFEEGRPSCSVENAENSRSVFRGFVLLKKDCLTQDHSKGIFRNEIVRRRESRRSMLERKSIDNLRMNERLRNSYTKLGDYLNQHKGPRKRSRNVILEEVHQILIGPRDAIG